MADLYRDLLCAGGRLALPIMTHPGIDHIGCSVLEAVTEGRVHARAIAALARLYPCAARTIIMDLTVEAEALGAPVRFGTEEIPSILEAPLRTAEEVARLTVPKLETARVPQYLLATRLALEAAPERPLLAGCIGPFSLAGRLYDMTELMLATYTEPEMVETLLEKVTDFLLNYARAFKATGAQGLIMAEPAAGLLSPEMCQHFSSRYVQRIVEQVQDDSFLFILHNCGNTGQATASMVATGARGLHFGNKIDLVQVLAQVPADRLVLGNIDPVSVFKNGTPESMRAQVSTLLRKTQGYPNFILSSGCDTPPGVPKENIDAFFEALAEGRA